MGVTIAAAGIAAHEAGHAVQHAKRLFAYVCPLLDGAFCPYWFMARPYPVYDRIDDGILHRQ